MTFCVVSEAVRTRVRVVLLLRVLRSTLFFFFSGAAF